MIQNAPEGIVQIRERLRKMSDLKLYGIMTASISSEQIIELLDSI
jgi:hypothetical protein